MRRVWERGGWRRAKLQWVQRQDARWRSKGGKGVSWRLRQRKQQPVTPTGDSQHCDAEAACARDWSRHWQAGAFAAWGWEG